MASLPCFSSGEEEEEEGKKKSKGKENRSRFTAADSGERYPFLASLFRGLRWVAELNRSHPRLSITSTARILPWLRPERLGKKNSEEMEDRRLRQHNVTGSDEGEGPVLPSPSVSHLIRESSTKTPHLSYENPIRNGCDQNQLPVTSSGLAWREPLGGVPYVGCHGWRRSKEHFFNKYI
ncbi:intraflagellar transport protein 43 homolog isoform X7 [Meriones unguiculatus]|uniref:intraflagellar transport protein 43 homolog isoform X7 n=1 Tax=Meriones unguiculatus TaxID=10047 RepID=UPI00293EA345|nr:intraflagellar transport protein 43 homolog isoform X7 [Meriones unguiculatus]